MPVKGMSVAYSVVGGLVLYSGIKGASLADTAKAVLSGNLTLTNTEPVSFPAGSPGGGSGGTGSGSANGAAILADAMKYNGHKYVFGGPSNPTNGWDCSSFVSYVLGHDMGLGIPGGSWASVTSSGKSHGPTAAAYKSWTGATTVQTSAVQPGDLLCWQTHVGFAVDGSHMFSAYDTPDGTLQTPWAGPRGEGAAMVRRVNATSSGGTAVTGSQVTNGTTIYKFFRSQGFTPIQAAGAIASIWGESGWDPESAGTGGRGLIGWTPASTLPNSAFTGNRSADMAAQLPLIMSFIQANGDSGAVQMMAGAQNVNSAAQIWDSRVERAGINDVHPTGISLAIQIAKTVDGVALQ